jgi:cell division septation protein DedD
MVKNKPSKPIRILSNILILFGLISLSSCLGGKTDNQATQIRIVDLNGNPKPIKRIVPEGNAQILATQQSQFLATNDNIPAPSNINQPLSNGPVENQNVEQNTSGDVAATSIDNTVNNAVTDNNKNKPAQAEVLYDLSEDKTPNNPENNNEVKDTAPKLSPEKITSSKTKFKLAISKAKNNGISADKKSGTLIQIGSFSSYANAQKALEKSKKISVGKIEEVDLENGKSYRVFLGPLSSSKKVHNILKKAKKSGYKDAFIVK